MSPIEYHYHFRCPGDEPRTVSFSVSLDPVTLNHQSLHVDRPPAWALLENHRCANCPLDASTHDYCPAALGLVDVVENFHDLLSYDEVEVMVVTTQRTITGITSAQRALSSLIGLYLATSGCPTLAKLKPMARFHLPFANRDETTFRTASAYLLGQFFLEQKGLPADFKLEGLKALYNEIHQINIALAERLRNASTGDANLNAIVLLDLFAQDVPLSLSGKLADLERLYSAYFDAAHLSQMD